MAIHVLIATNTPGYGELIQQTLMGSGEYRISLVSSGQEAIKCGETIEFDLAILDSDLHDIHLVELVKELKYIVPDLRLIIIPPEDNLGINELEAIHPDGFISKPFYMPDLSATVEAVMGIDNASSREDGDLGEKSLAWGNPANSMTNDQGRKSYIAKRSFDEGDMAPERETDDPISNLPWMRDVDQTAQHLARSILSASALAALLIKEDRIWAYAGQLNQAAAQELSDTVLSYKTKAGIRGRTVSDLARFIQLAEADREYLLYTTDLSDEMTLALGFDTSTPFSEIRIQTGVLARTLLSPPEKTDIHEASWDLEETQPLEVSEAGEKPGLRGIDLWDQELGDDPDLPSHIGPLFSRDEVPPPTPDEELDEQFTEDDEDELGEGRTDALEAVPVQEVDDINRALSVPEDYRRLSPVFQALYHITYACVLIPRLPEHNLNGDLPVRLAEWVRQISYAFNWRLEYLTVQPDYLLWVANAPPDMSPASLMDSVREHTSERIFGEFPRIKRQNPSGDFWTPGYLMLSGTQPPPTDLVEAYVGQTRRLQGVGW